VITTSPSPGDEAAPDVGEVLRIGERQRLRDVGVGGLRARRRIGSALRVGGEGASRCSTWRAGSLRPQAHDGRGRPRRA
jgi:hypothetical protein